MQIFLKGLLRIGSCNELSQNKWRVITWTNDDQVWKSTLVQAMNWSIRVEKSLSGPMIQFTEAYTGHQSLLS